MKGAGHLQVQVKENRNIEVGHIEVGRDPNLCSPMKKTMNLEMTN